MATTVAIDSTFRLLCQYRLVTGAATSTGCPAPDLNGRWTDTLNRHRLKRQKSSRGNRPSTGALTGAAFIIAGVAVLIVLVFIWKGKSSLVAYVLEASSYISNLTIFCKDKSRESANIKVFL
ncbi:hypothetical protein Dimus_034055 [Dionaea muscipula]